MQASCSYAKRCADLHGKDPDLKRRHLVAVRNKTKVSRITVLWPRTIAALKKLPRHGDAEGHVCHRTVD